MPFFSIIVPVYNAQRFINETISCVLNQDMNDFELILVNDGSTDNSLSIMDAFSQNNARISLYTINNSGPSAARNFGVNVSTGKYILFLDSDDTLAPNALSVIFDILNDYYFDLIIFGFRLVDNTTNDIYFHKCNDVTFHSLADINTSFGYLYKNNLFNQVWNKVFKSSILKDNNICFLDYKYGEDRLFVFDFLPYCDTIRVIDSILYDYNICSKNSLISTYYNQKFTVCNLIDDKIYDLQRYIGRFNSETLSDINYMYIKCVISCMTNFYHPSCDIGSYNISRGIKDIITHEKVKKAVSSYKSNDMAMNILVRIIKTENVVLNRISARFISISSTYLNRLFFKLKHPFAHKEHK